MSIVLRKAISLNSESEISNFYEQCYEDLFDYVYAMAVKILPYRWVADGVGELFLKILELDLQKLKDLENLEGYLLTLAKNHLLSFKKNLSRREHFPIVENFDSEQTILISNTIEFSIDFQTALKSLSDRQASALQLFLNGYSHEEIALKMDISVGASKNLIYRAKIGIENYYKNEKILNSSS